MSLQLNTTIPNLLVSQSSLQFPSTDVGDEQFLLVKIGQDGTNAPVRVSCEASPYFQVAVQGTPLRFSTEVTFIPEPGGTFVHVRYAPKHGGRHKSELVIETEQTTQSVALSGHTAGLLVRSLAPSSPGQSRLGLKIALTLALLGGATAVYWTAFRPGSQSSTMRPVMESPVTESARPASAQRRSTRSASRPVDLPVVLSAKERKLRNKRDEAPRTAMVQRESEPEKMETPPVRETPVRATPVRETRTRSAVNEPAVVTAEPPRPATPRPTADRAAIDATKKRPVPAKAKPTQVPSSESDLERELNGNQ
ncbi:hypothetical protein J2I47_19920 [Fibrella sp. HMF5335]|uniref:Uncharacterized protein n=1 Tax=Fibrella rubiginis TaxID=2817060 RepID=A0A939K7N9_9BACT|nr:hypothetical protein [Fibrella rubiginis]MBO0938830.1 hypothetical protein [Fibrella rubiginis]